MAIFCRKGSHGTGTFALPGGHLEFQETSGACAVRETLEETGLCVINPRLVWVEESVWGEEDNKQHYVTLFIRTDLADTVCLFTAKCLISVSPSPHNLSSELEATTNLFAYQDAVFCKTVSTHFTSAWLHEGSENPLMRTK